MNKTVGQRWPWWRVLQAAIALGFMGGLLVLWPTLMNWVNQPIARVEIRAPFHSLERAEVEERLKPYLVNRFFYLDLEEARQALLEMPWTREVSLRRIWPDALEVSLQEQEPVARWARRELITGDGVVFRPQSVEGFRHLPMLSGPEDQALVVMQQYLAISQLLRPMGLSVRELILGSAGSWRFQVDHVQVNVGRDRRMERLQRFVRLYHARLDRQWQEVVRVDLRYLNGAAVAFDEERSQP
ncbi:MAG: cell division protein FtsQ/DivIB [Endozoicomonas sp.]